MKVLYRGKTSNYSQFEMIDWNRDYDKNAAKRLAESIKRENMLEIFPVVCVRKDGRLRIVDGQHRFAACQLLEIPVHYIVVDEFSPSDLRLMSGTVEPWKTRHFLHHFIRLGRTDYKKLADFMEFSGMPLMISAALLSGESTTSGQLTRRFRDGSFRVANLEKAMLVSDVITKLEACGAKHVNSRPYVLALARIVKAAELDMAKLTRKAPGMVSHLKPCANWKQAAEAFSYAYDYRSPLEDRHDLLGAVMKMEREEAIKLGASKKH